MKICVATFYNINHPGAVLQAYALCRALTEMGHDARLIQYPFREAPKPPPLLSPNGIYAQLIGSAKRSEGYARFVQDFCPETSGRYESFRALAERPPEADAYVCGSDQIWNPQLTGGQPDPAYFLDFGDPALKRISYAASYGGVALSAEHKAQMSKWLARFTAFSAREREGVELIRELTGRPAELVVDPTLLVEGWQELAAPLRPAGSYVLLYQLQKSPEVYRAARAAARYYNKPLLHIDASPKCWTRPGRAVRPADPQQWLGLFQNAAAVVTNSFHGTVFSILFQRPFHCIPLTGDKAKRSGRMKDLCDRMGIAACFVCGEEQMRFTDLDWSMVKENLARVRSGSLHYLKCSLER